MECSKYKKLLVEFTDGRLDYQKNQDIQEHITLCTACRSEVDKLRSSIELVVSDGILSKEPEPPDNLPEHVLDRIYNETNHSKFSFNLALGIAAVICLLGLSLEVFLFHRASGDRETFMYQTAATSIKTDLPKIIISKHDTVQSTYFKQTDSEVKEKVKSVKNTQLSNVQHKNKNNLQQVNAHISMEILKLLGPTLEVIEGEEKEWEIEI